SPDIFETTEYDFETLSTRLREMAFLNKGLAITLRDERPQATDPGAEDDVESVETSSGPREVQYRYDNGLVDYVNHLNSSKTPVHRSVISFEAESEDGDGQAMSLEMALQWNDQFSESEEHTSELQSRENLVCRLLLEKKNKKNT